MEEKINHLENFVAFRNEKTDSNKENLNNELYDFLYDSSMKILNCDEAESSKVDSIIQKVTSTEVKKFEDLLNIYFYESKYSNTNKELQQKILYLSTFLSLSFDYNDFDSLEKIIQNDNNLDGQIAL